MHMSKNLILASGSKYKQALLQRLHIPFNAIAADIDESPLSNETAKELAKRLSIAKAQVIAEQHPESWIIGCDQVASCNMQFLNKPDNKDNAIRQLELCSNQEVVFTTGVSLYRHQDQSLNYDSNTVTVKFRELSLPEIESYLDKDKPYDCAGSFKVESLGITLFEWVKSDDPTSLEGLPLITVCRLLRKAGIEQLN